MTGHQSGPSPPPPPLPPPSPPLSSSQPSTISIVLAVGLVAATLGYFVGQGSTLGVFGGRSHPRASKRGVGQSSSSSSSFASHSESDPGRSRSRMRREGKSKSESESWPNSYDVTIHPDSSDEELMRRLQRRDRKAAQEQGDDGEGLKMEKSGDEDEDEDDDGGELGPDVVNSREEVKLVLAVRTDLGMGKGKIAAQCSHATLACYKHLLSQKSSAVNLLHRWEGGGQPKIAVQVRSEDDLTLLRAQAISLGLCAQVIHDAGRTQIAAGSATVLGVLGPKSIVDQVTGQLKLL